MLRKLTLVFFVVVLALAQDRPTFRVKVDLVVLSFTVTDNKGHYINGLQPKDVRILEDGIVQKPATFADVGLTPKMLAGAADMYRLVADTAIGRESPENRDRSRGLDGVIAALADAVTASAATAD